MNTGVADRFLNVFTTYIDSGFGLVGGEVAFLAVQIGVGPGAVGILAGLRRLMRTVPIPLRIPP